MRVPQGCPSFLLPDFYLKGGYSVEYAWRLILPLRSAGLSTSCCTGYRSSPLPRKLLYEYLPGESSLYLGG